MSGGQALAHLDQAEARAVGGGRRIEADAGIAHFDRQQLAVAPRAPVR